MNTSNLVIKNEVILITNVIINSYVQLSLTVGQVQRGPYLKTLVMSQDLFPHLWILISCKCGYEQRTNKMKNIIKKQNPDRKQVVKKANNFGVISPHPITHSFSALPISANIARPISAGPCEPKAAGAPQPPHSPKIGSSKQTVCCPLQTGVNSLQNQNQQWLWQWEDCHW